MPELKGLRWWLEDGDTGVPFADYATIMERNIVTTYIASEDGKSFKINFSYYEAFGPQLALNCTKKITPLAFEVG